MKYPLLCLNLRQFEVVVFPALIHDPVDIGTKEKLDRIEKYMDGEEFCDASGDIYILNEVRTIRKSWNLYQLFLHGFKTTYMLQYFFVKTGKSVSLEELKNICSDFAKNIFVDEAIEKNLKEIYAATTYIQVWDPITCS